ncbi:hypothetical protein DHD05_15695 [Arenibacter sp. N53]|nr:hypothetical protein [Arenibacter sp. N53]
MDNIQFNVDGIALNISSSSTFGYNKVMVPFSGLEDLYNCQYLGGKDYMGNKRVPNQYKS